LPRYPRNGLRNRTDRLFPVVREPGGRLLPGRCADQTRATSRCPHFDLSQLPPVRHRPVLLTPDGAGAGNRTPINPLCWYMLVIISELRVIFVLGKCPQLRLVTLDEFDRYMCLSPQRLPVLVDKILVPGTNEVSR